CVPVHWHVKRRETRTRQIKRHCIKTDEDKTRILLQQFMGQIGGFKRVHWTEAEQIEHEGHDDDNPVPSVKVALFVAGLDGIGGIGHMVASGDNVFSSSYRPQRRGGNVTLTDRRKRRPHRTSSSA